MNTGPSSRTEAIIVSTLAGFAICAAVFFFSHYWDNFGTPARVTIVTLAPLLALIGTEYGARRDRTFYIAGLMATVAFASFVLALNVLRDIFNLNSVGPAPLVLIALAMLLAYRYGLRLLLMIGLGYLVLFVAEAVNPLLGRGRTYELLAIQGLVVFAAPLVMPVGRHTDFPAVYRAVGSVIFFTAVLTLWGGGGPHKRPTTVEHIVMERVYEFTGLLTSAGALWLGIKRQWSGVAITGAVFFSAFLLIQLFGWLPESIYFVVIAPVAILIPEVWKRVRARLTKCITP